MDTLIDERAPRWATLERPRLVSWLDSILRNGSAVSIDEDTPFLFAQSDRVCRRLLLADGEPAAHAAAYEMTVDLPAGSVRAAVIGAVATSPRFRRRGYGSQVMKAIVEDIAARGITLAILWADVPDFYARLDFVLAGRETIFICPKRAWHDPRRMTARPATAADLPAIRDLHAREVCRVRRDRRTWETLFGLPRTNFYVLERKRRIVAYGVVGRGHDLAGCLHEWGGDDLLLPELVSAVAWQRTDSELYVMSPPWKAQAASAMGFHGIASNSGSLGMLRILDREALLRSLGLPQTTALPADHTELVKTLFGSSDNAEPNPAAGLPVQFYLSGLDSV